LLAAEQAKSEPPKSTQNQQQKQTAD